MAIPSRHEMRLGVLRQLADGREHAWGRLKANLEDHFALTPVDRQRADKRGNNLFATQLSRLVHYMRAEGLVERTTARGEHRITERGRFVLEQPPEVITATFWSRFKLPTVDTIMPVLLQHLGDREAQPYRFIRESLTTHFALTPVQRRAINPHSGLMWNRRCWDTCRELLRVHLVESASPGHYRITDLGFEVLQDPPEVVNRAFLKRFRLPSGRLERWLLQYIADEGPKSPGQFIAAFVPFVRTDTYPSSEHVWEEQSRIAVLRLARAGLVTSSDADAACEVTLLGRAALILAPKAFPLGFLNRIQEAAALLLR